MLKLHAEKIAEDYKKLLTEKDQVSQAKQTVLRQENADLKIANAALTQTNISLDEIIAIKPNIESSKQQNAFCYTGSG
ncbi:MAG: hypothetical protein LBQ54_06830 [Planctomycetaceae bacterium]|nr:hypothetical protein [Planctomycetaceae bacterium]